MKIWNKKNTNTIQTPALKCPNCLSPWYGAGQCPTCLYDPSTQIQNTPIQKQDSSTQINQNFQQHYPASGMFTIPNVPNISGSFPILTTGTPFPIVSQYWANIPPNKDNDNKIEENKTKCNCFYCRNDSNKSEESIFEIDKN